MPDEPRTMTHGQYLIEALVRGEDILTIARKRFGWSVTSVLDWLDQPWVKMHIAAARQMEEVRFDFLLMRVRGPVTQRLAELSLADGVAPETQRKAAEQVTRVARARDRQARAATTKPQPSQKPAPAKAAPAPPEGPAISETAASSEVSKAPAAPEVSKVASHPQDPPTKVAAVPPRLATPGAVDLPTPAPAASEAVAPVAVKRTNDLVDEPRARDDAQAADDRTVLAGPVLHGRGHDSGWSKPRTAAIDAPARACADRRGLRAGPGQKSRPPPDPAR